MIAEWLSPIAPDFEALTIQKDGESDIEFTQRIQSFIDNIGSLYDRMNRKALEDTLYAANAEGLLLGISGRISQINELKARRRRKFRARARGN